MIKVTLTNNALMLLFNRVSYSLNGTLIKDIKDPRRTCLLKGV